MLIKTTCTQDKNKCLKIIHTELGELKKSLVDISEQQVARHYIELICENLENYTIVVTFVVEIDATVKLA